MNENFKEPRSFITVQRMIIVLLQILIQYIDFSKIDAVHYLKSNRVKLRRKRRIVNGDGIHVCVIVNTNTVCHNGMANFGMLPILDKTVCRNHFLSFGFSLQLKIQTI